MPQPITIDLSGLQSQFGLSNQEIDMLTETCVNAVTAVVYANWQALAKQRLNSTVPEYLQNIIKVDKGRFAKQIVLTGILPNMIEQGASAFDMKEGFKKSSKVRYTIPVYNAKGKQVRKGGDWYLTIPFRHGTPGIVGQAGFANEMPQEIYDIMRKRQSGRPLTAQEIPSPYDVPRSRAAIEETPNNPRYDEYVHKSSIYEGLTKITGQYGKTTQNMYGTFRRVSNNSSPLSWIHKGIKAYNLADEAIKETDVETIVENEVLTYLEGVL
jgi:hypothetical protein